MVGGIFYEHGHRMVAAAVSTLVGIQALVLGLFETRKGVKRLGYLAFGAILLQAVLGGLTVIYLLPPAISSAHAGLAEIVFALTATLALMTSDRYRDGSLFDTAGLDDEGRESLRAALRLTAAATAVLYVQIIVGAVMRHTGAGLAVPDFPLAFGRLLPTATSLAARGVAVHLAHRFGALVALLLVALAARSLFRVRNVSRLFSTLGASWLVLVAAQITLGAFSIWSRKAVPITTAHLAVGALCWVTGVLAVISVSRASSLADSSERTVGSKPSAVPTSTTPALVERSPSGLIA
jgi:cytochrome c oxidase assembly protein subunit 15